jgi:hypothetical protein
LNAVTFDERVRSPDKKSDDYGKMCTLLEPHLPDKHNPVKWIDRKAVGSADGCAGPMSLDWLVALVLWIRTKVLYEGDVGFHAFPLPFLISLDIFCRGSFNWLTDHHRDCYISRGLVPQSHQPLPVVCQTLLP